MSDQASHDTKPEPMKKRISAGDLIFSVILIFSGLYVIYSAVNMRVFQTILDAPGLFPFVLGLIITLLGVLLLNTSIKTGGLVQIREMVTSGYWKEVKSRFGFQRVIVLILLMVIYIFGLIGRLHFTLATMIYLVVTFFYLKATGAVRILISAVLISLIIGYSFRNFFGIPLP